MTFYYSAGFDNIPMEACKSAGIRVGRVPSYSPSSIAEYAVSSIMSLAKNIQKSYELTKQADFRIGGLQCILLEDKVAGVIGTGLIGKILVLFLKCFVYKFDEIFSIYRQEMRSKIKWIGIRSSLTSTI